MAQPISPAVQKDFRDDLVVGNSPSFLSSDGDILPVMAVGQGIARNNARQAVKTYSFSKTSVGGETFYIQVATVSANVRIFFLGGMVQNISDTIYVEDASTGNVALTDGGSVALFDSSGESIIVPPREVKRGIRIALAVGAGSTSAGIIYYLEERTDGQLENL